MRVWYRLTTSGEAVGERGRGGEGGKEGGKGRRAHIEGGREGGPT